MTTPPPCTVHARAEPRAKTDAYGGATAAALASLCRDWDRSRSLTADENDRAEWVAMRG